LRPSCDVPDGAIKLDHLIGDAPLRGRRLGSRIIAMAIDSARSDHPTAPAVLGAVVAANTSSWLSPQKAGLRRIAEGTGRPDNPVDDPLRCVHRMDRP